ncbi:ABC-2 type transport system permease protein [Haloechinothrix alba]|uniref:ABC-2 type transport system permease protein n=1 Tax=Haloechinothrix alba TaxID=664784 RepID=A0A238VF10_9PSEU|nr:ABC transporter permease [Haloechinothrix alba]SNR32647.1 ABC-2 type transport system permease protein [Haloechinothrix alba]
MSIATRARSGTVARVASLARAETTLLRRNKLLLFNAVVIPLLPVALLLFVRAEGELTDEAATTALTLMIAALLLFAVYYNLLSSVVARREELVLKRMRAGECSDAEILAGTALPAIGIALAMVALMILVGSAALGLPAPSNPVLLVLGILGGALTFTALALITTTVTRNSEAAQITSMPVIMIAVLGLPLVADGLPEQVRQLAPYLPLHPVMELATLGWMGTTLHGDSAGFAESFTHAWEPGLVILGWLVLGALVARSYFRWEPRR